jgi:PRTRC genetic system protein A
MCPRYEALDLLAEEGHRYVVGGDGLYIEVRRPWLHALVKFSNSPLKLPYGQPPKLFSIRLRRQELIDGLRVFIRRARRVSPLEHAAWLSFSPAGSRINYVEPEILASGRGHIQYHRPDATPFCLPIIDCHSHGEFPAFFSDTDGVDDRMDDAKLSFVVGNLDKSDVSVALRFVGFGLSLDFSDWARSLVYPVGVIPDGGPSNERE